MKGYRGLCTADVRSSYCFYSTQGAEGHFRCCSLIYTYSTQTTFTFQAVNRSTNERMNQSVNQSSNNGSVNKYEEKLLLNSSRILNNYKSRYKKQMLLLLFACLFLKKNAFFVFLEMQSLYCCFKESISCKSSLTSDSKKLHSVSGSGGEESYVPQIAVCCYNFWIKNYFFPHLSIWCLVFFFVSRKQTTPTSGSNPNMKADIYQNILSTQQI